jgi:hypothetical protein
LDDLSGYFPDFGLVHHHLALAFFMLKGEAARVGVANSFANDFMLRSSIWKAGYGESLEM